MARVPSASDSTVSVPTAAHQVAERSEHLGPVTPARRSAATPDAELVPEPSPFQPRSLTPGEVMVSLLLHQVVEQRGNRDEPSVLPAESPHERPEPRVHRPV